MLLGIVSLSLYAGNGTTRGQAIDFKMEKQYSQDATRSLWYKIDVAELKQMQNPTLALYFTNTSASQSAHIQAVLYPGSSTTELGTQELDLEPGQYRVMSTNIAALKSFTYDYVVLKLTMSGSTDDVIVSSKAVETNRVELDCKSSAIITKGAAATVVGANSGLKWYNFDIAGYTTNAKKLQLVITATAAGSFATSLSFDCPCTSSTDATVTLAAGETYTTEIAGDVLAALKEFRGYYSVRTNAAYTLQLIEATDGTSNTTSVSGVTDYDWSLADGMPLAQGDNWFKLEYDSLSDDLIIPNYEVRASAASTITTTMAYKRGSEYIVLDEYDWSFASAHKRGQLEVNTIMGLARPVDGEIYFNVHMAEDNADAMVKFSMHTIFAGGEDCATAVDFDVVGGEYSQVAQDLDKLYRVNLSYFKDHLENGNHCDVKIFVDNNGSTDNTIQIAQVNCDVPLSESSYKTKVLAPGETYSRVIKYSQYSALEDVVYFRIKATTDWTITTEWVEATPVNDDACESATEFDWRYGHAQEANTSVWYHVALDTVAKTTFIPQFVVENKGTAKSTVKFQYAYVCPVEYELASPESHTIAAGATYQKALTRESLMGYANNEYWVKVTTGSQPAYWKMYFEQDNTMEGAFCETAIDFNWVGGNTQGDTTRWYRVDLAYAKNQPSPSTKMIQLHIDNLSSSQAAKVAADIAFQCPAQSAYQHYDATIPAGATKPAVGSKQGRIPYTMYENLDEVWVRLKSNQSVHIWAEVLEDTDAETVDICDELDVTIHEFQFDQPIALTTDTVWYYFPTAKFNDPSFADLTYVPEVTLVNNTSSSITAKAEVSFHCAFNASMPSKSVKVKAGSTYTNSVERDVIDGYINGYDTVYVRITGAAGLTMTATMIDPNLGEECLKAIAFQYNYDHLQEAGETWYKIDVTTAQGKEVTAKFTNKEASAKKVTVAFYSACDTDPLVSTTRSVGANSTLSREIGDLINGYAGQYIYMSVTSAGEANVRADLSDLPTGDSIHVCDSSFVKKLEPNVIYHQEAGDSVWYYINFAELDTTISGNMTVKIDPVCGPVHIKGRQWWDCATDALPTEKNLVVSTPYEREVEHGMISSLRDEAWILIKGDQCFDFTIEAVVLKGDEACNPIEFDWDYCNIVPAGSVLWYHVNVDTLLNNPDKDLKLMIENLETTVTHVKVDSVRFTCLEKVSMFGNINKELAAGEIKSQFVDNTLLQDFNVGNNGIYMRVTTDGQVRICPELVDALQDSIVYDTLTMDLCYSDDLCFLDPYYHTGTYCTSTDTIVCQYDHSVLNWANPQSFQLSDTVPFRYDGTFHGDSIRFYDIHVIRNATLGQPIDSAVLNALAIEAGKKLDADFRDLVISQLADTVAKIRDASNVDMAGSFVWEIGSWNDTDRKYENFSTLTEDYTDPFQAGKFLGLRLTYVNECGDNVTDTLEVALLTNTLHHVVTVVDTVCAGTIFGSYTINADTTIKDSVRYITSVPYDMQADSVIINEFHVFTFNVSALDPATDYPEMQAGLALDTLNAASALRFNVLDDNTYPAAITSIEFAYNQESDKHAAYVSMNELSATDKDSAWVAYTINFDCSEVRADTIRIKLLPADTLAKAVEEHLCYGATYTTRKGTIVTADGTWSEKAFNDTIHNVFKGTDLSQKYDSIYLYKFTTLVPKDSVATYTICEGDEINWFGNVYTTAQTNKLDTIRTALGCDSIWGKLNIVVHEVFATEMTDTLCFTDNSYVWHIGYKDNGVATTWDSTIVAMAATGVTGGVFTRSHTVPSVHGCDSVVTLKLTISPQPVTGSFIHSSCLGSDFVWVAAERGELTDTIISAPAAPGDYTFTHTAYSSLGCESGTYTLLLHVPSPTPTPFSAKVCQDSAYVWENGTHNITPATSAVGTFMVDDTIVSHFGCDSILRLTYEVTPKYYFENTHTMCDNASYKWMGHKGDIEYSNLVAGTHVFWDSLLTVGCGCDSVYKLTITVNPTYASEVFDTICYNTPLPVGPLTNGSPIDKYITASGDYDEHRLTKGCLCDSIITHHVTVRTKPVPPTNASLGVVPVVECGVAPEFGDVNDAIEAYIATIQPTEEQVQAGAYTWQVRTAQNTWADLDFTSARPEKAGDKLYLRYVLHTECGSDIPSDEFLITVVVPSSDKSYGMLVLPLVNKYDDWLLMINKKEAQRVIKGAGLGLDSLYCADVRWYVQNGSELDQILEIDANGNVVMAQVAGDVADEPVSVYSTFISGGDGNCYITSSQSLNGSLATVPGCSHKYYAVLVFADGINGQDDCGAVIRTEVYDAGNDMTAPSRGQNNNAGSDEEASNIQAKRTPVITPTLVMPGNAVYVYNLNPDVVTTIEVFDTMGECIDRLEVSGQETYTYQTGRTRTGCFLMNISSADDARALKFIVK